MRKPLKEARPPLLEDRKGKMKRARSPSNTSSLIPQLDGTYAPSFKTHLLSRLQDTEESKPESAPKHEPYNESAPEPEPETEAGPESETELEMELKPPVNIANPVFTFCEEKECTVCPVRHNAIRAFEKVDNQIKILHWHSKSNFCLSYESLI